MIYENDLLTKVPEDDDWSFIPAISKAFQGKTLNDIVIAIDHYYAAHPNDLDRPVVETVIDEIVIPAL